MESDSRVRIYIKHDNNGVYQQDIKRVSQQDTKGISQPDIKGIYQTAFGRLNAHISQDSLLETEQDKIIKNFLIFVEREKRNGMPLAVLIKALEDSSDFVEEKISFEQYMSIAHELQTKREALGNALRYFGLSLFFISVVAVIACIAMPAVTLPVVALTSLFAVYFGFIAVGGLFLADIGSAIKKSDDPVAGAMHKFSIFTKKPDTGSDFEHDSEDKFGLVDAQTGAADNEETDQESLFRAS